MPTINLDDFQLRDLINALNKISKSLEGIERELKQMRYKV